MVSNTPGLIQLQAPVSDETKFSNKEKIVLLKSSKLHSSVFPPWKGTPETSEFLESWEDNTDFRLSQEQQEAFDGWTRPPAELESLIHQNSKVDLVQDVTTDCSVVASLCALTARSERLGSQYEDIHRTIRFPESPSTNGKYIYKLHFNGCYRKVVIDDRLPKSKAIRSLHCLDRNDPSNVCPALMEKAYLKVRGGYDFAGSNSGTDLWILTGWIPEQLFLQSEDVIPRALWKRIYNAFNYGDVLITLGTNKMSRKEEKLLGLTGEHAYAVLDLREKDDKQLFLIKNPWSKGGTWTGYTDPHDLDAPNQLTGDGFDGQLSEGTFWMDLHNVINYFHTIYLNWNPGLFNHRNDAHFSWDLSRSRSRNSLSGNPQYLLQTREANTVYLVLTKHFQDLSGNHHEVEVGYMSLYAYESNHRVLLRGQTVQQSHYLDAPNVLLRLELPAKASYVIVVAEQDLPSEELRFSLSAFSLKPLMNFCPAQEEYQYSLGRQGVWSAISAGGNATSPHYNRNPQFSLHIAVPTDLALTLETSDTDLAVHVKVVWAGGQRIPTTVMSKDVYGDSGEYSRGCTMMRIQNALPGVYTVVCSTFEEGQVGNFTLSLNSNSSRCDIRPILREEAGMIVLRTPPARLRKGVDRLLAPVSVVRNSRVRFVARNPLADGGNPSSPIKLSIELGQGPTKSVLTDTGDFASKAELRTSELDLSSSMTAKTSPGVWLVIERVASSGDIGNEDIQIDVLSNVPGVEVAAWGKESNDTIEEIRKRMSDSRIYM